MRVARKYRPYDSNSPQRGEQLIAAYQEYDKLSRLNWRSPQPDRLAEATLRLYSLLDTLHGGLVQVLPAPERRAFMLVTTSRYYAAPVATWEEQKLEGVLSADGVAALGELTFVGNRDTHGPLEQFGVPLLTVEGKPYVQLSIALPENLAPPGTLFRALPRS